MPDGSSTPLRRTTSPSLARIGREQDSNIVTRAKALHTFLDQKAPHLLSDDALPADVQPQEDANKVLIDGYSIPYNMERKTPEAIRQDLRLFLAHFSQERIDNGSALNGIPPLEKRQLALALENLKQCAQNIASDVAPAERAKYSSASNLPHLTIQDTNFSIQTPKEAFAEIFQTAKIASGQKAMRDLAEILGLSVDESFPIRSPSDANITKDMEMQIYDIFKQQGPNIDLALNALRDNSADHTQLSAFKVIQSRCQDLIRDHLETDAAFEMYKNLVGTKHHYTFSAEDVDNIQNILATYGDDFSRLYQGDQSKIDFLHESLERVEKAIDFQQQTKKRRAQQTVKITGECEIVEVPAPRKPWHVARGLAAAALALAAGAAFFLGPSQNNEIKDLPTFNALPSLSTVFASAGGMTTSLVPESIDEISMPFSKKVDFKIGLLTPVTRDGTIHQANLTPVTQVTAVSAAPVINHAAPLKPEITETDPNLQLQTPDSSKHVLNIASSIPTPPEFQASQTALAAAPTASFAQNTVPQGKPAMRASKPLTAPKPKQEIFTLERVDPHSPVNKDCVLTAKTTSVTFEFRGKSDVLKQVWQQIFPFCDGVRVIQSHPTPT